MSDHAPTKGTFVAPEEPLLRYFAYEHLASEGLRTVSKQFSDLAHRVVELLPRSAERTVALRKLLEAKDSAVRAALDGVR